MKILVVSDLHLEFKDLVLDNPGVDVLVLAGDIMTVEPWYARSQKDDYSSWMGKRAERYQIFKDFLDRVTSTFPHVVWVAGNHEFYGFRWYQTLEVATWISQGYNNLYFLERNSVKIDGVEFVGATLWTSMNKADPIVMYTCGAGMNDYRAIVNDRDGFRGLRPSDTVYRHRDSVNYMSTAVEGLSKVVVVTHHAPTPMSVHQRYVGDTMNYAYHSDLSEWILDRPQVKLWLHGHTHDPYDYMVGSTRVVCNPRGYHHYEDTGWDPSKILEV